MRTLLVVMLLAFTVDALAVPEINRTVDESFLYYGFDAYEDGYYGDARANFERAARYGNRQAQMNLAVMYWTGIGASKNKPVAWAWADLASSSGSPHMKEIRAAIAAELDDEGRKAAIAARNSLSDEYGDTVAQQRRDRWVRMERAKTTGSRLGLITGSLRIISPDHAYVLDGDGDMVTRGGHYYDDMLDEYQVELQLPKGRVKYGEFRVYDFKIEGKIEGGQ